MARVPLVAVLAVLLLAAAADAIPARRSAQEPLPEPINPSNARSGPVKPFLGDINAQAPKNGADLPTSPAPVFEKEPESDEEMLAHPCTTHGVMTEEGTCHCEEGFTGFSCEQVIISGQMTSLEGGVFPNCTVKVYDSRSINELYNLIAEGKCDDQGLYHFPVPHRHQYVLAVHSMQGTERRALYTVPAVRSRRDVKNRDRRSHWSLWLNVLHPLPYMITGEMWWIDLLWGYDHDIGTCDLNMGIYAPHFNQSMIIAQNLFPKGCIGDTFYYRGQCYDDSNWYDHSIEPMASWDHSCENFEYGEEYLYLFETDRDRWFDIYVYNSLWDSFPNAGKGDYDRFRNKYLPDWNPFWTWGYDEIFAHVHIYKAGEGGFTELVQIIDVANSTNSTLHPGLFWHVAKLEVNTIPENSYMDEPSNGTVHEINTIHCSPIGIYGTDRALGFEMVYINNWRGSGCPCEVDGYWLNIANYTCYECTDRWDCPY